MVNGKRQETGSAKRSSERIHGEDQADGDGEQPLKRSRVSRACDQCRASRERCDGTQPTCHTCTSQNRTCTFNEKPKKRGIQPNYIRTLELTLAWIFETFPETEARLINGLPVSNDAAHLLIGGKDATATESLHTAWRDCLVNRQIEQLLSGGTLDTTGQTVHSNTTISNDVSAMPYNSPPLSAPSDSSCQRPNRLTVPDSAAAEHLPATHTSRYRLPKDALTLLEYYFAFTHSWLPMTDKSTMLKIMYSYPTEGLPLNDIGTAEHAELWAIMALTTVQVHHDEPNDDIRRTRQVAESLLPAGNASFELPHIKASILLAIADVHEDRMLAAWLRIGTVVRLLYLFNILQSLGQTTRFCRHLHLVAFVIEGALGTYLNAPGHLTAERVNSVGFVDEDGIEEWGSWEDPLNMQHQSTKAPARSFSTLNKLVRLSQRSTTISSMDSAKSIVFNLLRNAASKKDRAQPSNLVAMCSNMTSAEPDWPPVNTTLNHACVGMPSLGSGQSDRNEVIDFQNAQRDHPFMSIPNEAAAYGLGTSPAMPPSASTLWTLNQAVDSMGQHQNITSPGTTADGLSNDIFEELANLERQDSIQQPQFMRNLGFAPDLDLAEFFGQDYQPSDPLLAYFQPSAYGGPQNTTETTDHK